MSIKSGIGRKPSIFVSSTCYDLSQIRADIKSFIEQQLGFEPILSEFNTFPIEPNLGALDNCLRVVQERADIFILVVGGRYGYETNNGKSITNLEYIRAKAKGIPIYVFVAKSVLNMLKVWKDNPNGNFNSIVDSPKLFEFVDTLRGTDNIWVYGFENAQDIIEALHRQLAYLFYDCLFYRNQIRSLKLPKKLLSLNGEALRLVMEKPDAWEYLLFGQVLEDGINNSIDLRRDLKYGIILGDGISLEEAPIILSWINTKLNTMLKISSDLDSLYNHAIQEALGLPGMAGDADHIVYAAERIVEIYRSTIHWALDCKSVVIADDWQKLIIIVSKFSDAVILGLENYSIKYNSDLHAALGMISDKDITIKLDLTLKIQDPDLSEFNKELNRLKRKYLL